VGAVLQARFAAAQTLAGWESVCTQGGAKLANTGDAPAAPKFGCCDGCSHCAGMAAAPASRFAAALPPVAPAPANAAPAGVAGHGVAFARAPPLS
jgi:hypothetical protein